MDPPQSRARNPVLNTITQRVDHFNPRDTKTWAMVIPLLFKKAFNCFVENLYRDTIATISSIAKVVRFSL